MASIKAIIRSVAAIPIGYFFKALGNAVYFAFAGLKPGDVPDFNLNLVSIPIGILMAIIGGYAAGLVAGRKEILHAGGAAALASIMAVQAILGGASKLDPSIQWANLFLMIPFMLLGGYLRNRQVFLMSPPDLEK